MLLLLVAAPLQAQTNITINPQVGLNFGFLSDDPFHEVENLTIKSNSQVGWQIGAMLRIGSRAHFQPGVFYQYLGIELEAPPNSIGDITEVVKESNYIHSLWVPLEFGFDILESEAFKLRGHAGASGTFILSVPDNDLGITKDDMKTSAWGVIVGAGVDFLMLSADVSYEFGLTEVYENDPVETKRNVLRLSVGLPL
jgi:hypothetical protein